VSYGLRVRRPTDVGTSFATLRGNNNIRRAQERVGRRPLLTILVTPTSQITCT